LSALAYRTVAEWLVVRSGDPSFLSISVAVSPSNSEGDICGGTAMQQVATMSAQKTPDMIVFIVIISPNAPAHQRRVSDVRFRRLLAERCWSAVQRRCSSSVTSGCFAPRLCLSISSLTARIHHCWPMCASLSNLLRADKDGCPMLTNSLAASSR